MSESSLSASTPKRDSAAAEESMVKVPQIELSMLYYNNSGDCLIVESMGHIYELFATYFLASTCSH